MVYCTSCGTKNSDEAEKCSKCGEPLYAPSSIDRAVDTCFGEPRQRYDRDACFGIPGIVWPLLIGAFIVIWGISILTGTMHFWQRNIWAIFVVLVGLIMIISALSRRR